MLRKISVIFVCLGLTSTAMAADLPTEFDPNSKYRLDYSDLNAVLKGSVLDMGPSTHKRAKKSRKSTGSKMRTGNPLPSRLEGNRIMFHQYEPQQVNFLKGMRDDLLAIPSQISLARLTKDAQLAYWLNLHNSIVLAKIAEEYPITDIEPFFNPDDADAFYKQAQFDLNGQMISLEDIQNHVVENWDDPLVIYGFFMGAIGTPNVRNEAYTANTVYAQLEDNAKNFVNSVRGTQVWRKKELRVATYYERMGKQFPDFENSVMSHVRKYAKPEFLNKMSGVDRVSAQIEDWHIADLYNGRLSKSGGTFAGNTSDALGIQIISGLPDHVVELLRYRDEKNATIRREENVVVEEVDTSDN
ncbi:DUF547 domain-containing protein [Kordiimonas aquimaris]|uniref:DUF547 domain-containing protein n=1 Tax=Kordiimonas aquimaris TaxID=707591 RepID=UPI0021CF768D|nr:DUF547 domain-containing protein [Kordiimonas aquimaris]